MSSSDSTEPGVRSDHVDDEQSQEVSTDGDAGLPGPVDVPDQPDSPVGARDSSSGLVGPGLADRVLRTEQGDAGAAGDAEQLELFTTQVQHFSTGPLPPVEQLRAYGDLDPSFPERIVRMAEASTSDQSVRLDAAVASDIKARARGQWTANSIAAVCVIASIVFFAVGNVVAGSVLLGMPVVFIIRALLKDDD